MRPRMCLLGIHCILSYCMSQKEACELYMETGVGVFIKNSGGLHGLNSRPCFRAIGTLLLAGGALMHLQPDFPFLPIRYPGYRVVRPA